MAVWFLVPGSWFLHFVSQGCVCAFRLPPSALLLLCSMTSDSTSSRLPLLLSACRCPAGGSHTHTHIEGSAVAAAAGGQPSGMIPLISSHLILVSSASSPPSRALQPAGKGPAVRPVTLSALPKLPSKPQLSGKRSHCHTTHIPPLPCCHLRSLEVGIVMDSDSLVARPRREEPENRLCMHTHTHTHMCTHQSVSQTDRLGHPVSAL